MSKLFVRFSSKTARLKPVETKLYGHGKTHCIEETTKLTNSNHFRRIYTRINSKVELHVYRIENCVAKMMLLKNMNIHYGSKAVSKVINK